MSGRGDLNRALLVAAGALALEGCATSRYIEGRNAGVTYTNGAPSILFIESDSGAKQAVELSSSTRIREGVCPSESRSSGVIDTQGARPLDEGLLKVVERGGGRVCVQLVRRGGQWLAPIVTFAPSAEQKSALKHAYTERMMQKREEEQLGIEERAQAQTIRQAEITAWRKRRHKPLLPEQVRRDGILAESAVREGRSEEAIKYYEDGLQVEKLWPEGHLHVALLYGERREYARAVEHLRWYLDLVPDSDDAPAMRDKLALWQQQDPNANHDFMQAR